MAPPSDAGSEKLTTAEPFSRTAETDVGAPGTAAGTNAEEADDHGPSPIELCARARHVYVFPFVKPETATGDTEPDPVPEAPPSDDSHDTVYEEIASPPSHETQNATDAAPSPGVTVGAQHGPSGTDAAVNEAVVAGAPRPTELVACTAHV